MKRLFSKPLIWIVLGCLASIYSPTLFGGDSSSRTRANEVVRIVADLDGDHQPDIATARIDHSIIKISIHLSSGHTRILLSAPVAKELGLKLTAYDVDEDSNLDLVLTNAVTNKPIALWLNTSKGRFEKIKSWVPPIILERELGPHFHRHMPQAPDQSVVGFGNPVPSIIVHSRLLHTLVEDRQDIIEGLATARLRPLFSTFDRGPPFV